jgi:hypothetical protein
MNTFTAQELVDFYQQVVDGGQIEFIYSHSADWQKTNCGPTTLSNHEDWRIKPTKKVIDLAVLIDSQIDCEFQGSSSMSWAIGKLRHHVSCSKKPMYHMHWDIQGFTKCRPRRGHKHAWDGGECPIEGFVVRAWVDKQDFLTVLTSSNSIDWSKIMYVEFLETEHDYVMPWESE